MTHFSLQQLFKKIAPHILSEKHLYAVGGVVALALLAVFSGVQSSGERGSALVGVQRATAQKPIDWDSDDTSFELPQADLSRVQDDLLPGKASLSLPEREAINKYTSGAYEKINGLLRKSYTPTTAQEKADLEKTIRLISSGLAKLKPYVGEVYRYSNLRKTLLAGKYVVGETVTEPFFVSTAQTREGTKIDSLLSGSNDQEHEHVYFVIHAKKRGKPIAPYSVYSWEKEVLFDQGSKFKINSKKTARSSGKTYLQIEMTEVN